VEHEEKLDDTFVYPAADCVSFCSQLQFNLHAARIEGMNCVGLSSVNSATSVVFVCLLAG